MRVRRPGSVAWLAGLAAAGIAAAQSPDATRGIDQLRQRMNPGITQEPPKVREWRSR